MPIVDGWLIDACMWVVGDIRSIFVAPWAVQWLCSLLSIQHDVIAFQSTSYFLKNNTDVIIRFSFFPSDDHQDQGFYEKNCVPIRQLVAFVLLYLLGSESVFHNYRLLFSKLPNNVAYTGPLLSLPDFIFCYTTGSKQCCSHRVDTRHWKKSSWDDNTKRPTYVWLIVYVFSSQ